MDALKKNLRQEHVLIHEFLSTFYTQVTTKQPSCPACACISAHTVLAHTWLNSSSLSHSALQAYC